jgi:hypothetical protein
MFYFIVRNVVPRWSIVLTTGELTAKSTADKYSIGFDQSNVETIMLKLIGSPFV